MRYLFFILILCNSLWGNNSLRVGMELSYPPFETVNEKGEPSGISVDLANELGKYLQREVIIVNLPYIGLIPALNNGQIDLIISSMSVTNERAKAIDFSDPYLSIGLALLINKNSSIQSVKDLNQRGKRVVVKIGTTAYRYAEQYLPQAKVIILDKESSAVMEVIQGKADAFIYDQLSIYNNWKKNQKTTRALLTPIQKEYWAIGIKKGNEGLKAEVNGFLKKFCAKGVFKKNTMSLN